MTPKDKAQELTDKFQHLVTTWDCYNDTLLHPEDTLPDRKKCAQIAVDEILDCVVYVSNQDAVWLKKEETSDYWQQVKKEIENL